MKKAKLLLEDGREFIGKSVGELGTSFGEIVFNTGMTGYQETLTDPSYAGQIITFTYPEIGNVGCNKEDYESANRHASYAKGMVIKNYSPVVSNFRAEESLDSFLRNHDIVGIYDIDTRALTKHIREKGAMRAAITTHDISSDKLKGELIKTASMEGLDLASKVSTKEKYTVQPVTFKDKKIIAYDFGIKQNILNRLTVYGCEVEVVPANTPAAYVISQNPDGVFLSNGPGDPAAVSYAIEEIKKLIDHLKPKAKSDSTKDTKTEPHIKAIFGICLGHQLLALAAGASTYKLKFGHRGANQPIKNLETEKIEIASHNHGFAVSKEELPKNLEITHLNINDDTIAGLKFKDKPIFSVQYHPEASPGPHDSDYLFKNFIEIL